MNEYLFRAFDYVVNSGLVDGKTEEERTLSAIEEVIFEIDDHPEEYPGAKFTREEVTEYVTLHYDPR
jgi:hypothetical protein